MITARLPTTLVVLAALLVFSALVSAQDFDKGRQAADRGDYAGALREFRPLAEEGDAWAQLFLGALHEEGLGVPQDYAEAARWYRLSANQDNPAAQYNLGVIYENGLGLPQDHVEAVRWYSLAAEQGIPRAQNNLGAMYISGQGTPQNTILAYKWFYLAAALGYKDAPANRDVVSSVMTPDQITEAQRLAREWLARHK